MNTDMVDHLVTGGLALGCIAGAIVIQLHSGETPDWLITIAGAASGFYFRGRVNGQYNRSLMQDLERKRKEIEA